jgi:hypothetical protein
VAGTAEAVIDAGFDRAACPTMNIVLPSEYGDFQEA